MEDNIALLAIIAAAFTVAAIISITTLFRIANTLREIRAYLEALPGGLSIAREVVEKTGTDISEIRRDTNILVDTARTVPTAHAEPEHAEEKGDDTDWPAKYQHLASAVTGVLVGEYAAPHTYTVPAAHGYQDGVAEVVTRLRAALRDQ